MGILSAVLITLVTLSILMVVHEMGHLLVARRCGIKVERFQIGFGRPLFSWNDTSGTQYALAPILLGAYVKMLDERDGDIDDNEIHMAHNRKSVWQRMAVAVAGPAANFLLSILVFWVLFFSGEKGYAPIIGDIELNSPAFLAGIKAGQEIIAIGGKDTPTKQAVAFRLLDYLGETGQIEVLTKEEGSDLTKLHSISISEWLIGVDNPDLFSQLGIGIYSPPIIPLISKVVSDGAAHQAGFLPGDLIIKADDREIKLWNDWVQYVQERPGKRIQVEFIREKELLLVDLIPASSEDSEGNVVGRVGMWVESPKIPKELQREFDRDIMSAFEASLVRTYELSLFTLKSIKKMIMGLISPANLSGPITIAKVATASALSGLDAYLGFLALLSISLGVLNLLPIPVLDGGHLLYYSMEVLLGRPIPEKIQVIGFKVGLFLILGIMILAVYNDLVRL